MKRIYLILFFALPFIAQAQVTLLKNINNSLSVQGSKPETLVSFGGFVYYAATDGVTGIELWRSDGTVAGTTRVRDIFPGDQDSKPGSLTVVGSFLYFVANDGDHGVELWRTDGTAKGTILVSDINRGVASGNPSYLTNVNNTTVIFGANDGDHGQEIWKTDVATGTTTMIEDLNANGAIGSNPSFLTNVNGTVYFAATDDAVGTELYKTDGTTAVLVEDIASGTLSSEPHGLSAFNDKLLFIAEEATNGPEPYVSNGTAASTFKLKTINSNGVGSFPTNFTTLGTFAYFGASDNTQNELWRTDGSMAGTVMFADINTTSGSSSPKNFIVFNGFLYFNATGSVASGTELWKTNGVAAPTIAANINTQTNGHSNPMNFAVFNNALYFNAFTNAEGQELYKYNGTSLSPVFDVLPGTAGSGPKNLCGVGASNLFFAADDGTGQELFKYNGTSVSQVVDLVSGSSGSDPAQLLPYSSSQIIFSADDGTGADLWKTDGTTGGTVAFQAGGKINTVGTASANINYMTLVGNTAYFRAMGSDADVELYKYDGVNVTKINVNVTGSSNVLNLYALNSTTLLFTAYTDAAGYELYKITNGSSTASLVKDINPGVSSSSPEGFVKYSAAPGFVYFRAETAANGIELWRTDGTTANTTLVADIEAGAAHGVPQYITELNGNLYFEANRASVGGYELFKWNGTAISLVKDIHPTSQSQPILLTVFNGDLYFNAKSSGTSNYELFKMDGSNEKVGLVKEINPDASAGSSVNNFTIFNSKLYFTANDGTNGNEMWVTDGTALGTVMFKEMNPGGGSGSMTNPVIVGTKMYFVGASDTGVDIWVTDGTSCNTISVPYAGGQSSSAKFLTTIGTKLVFSMTAQGTGQELFLLDPALITFPTPVGITTHPASKSVLLGVSTTFTVVATGTGLTYQWQKGGVNINGATSSSYTIPSPIDTDAGDYRVIVKGTCGQLTSNVATLTVTATTPLAQPTELVISSPTTTSLTVSFKAASPAVSGYLVLRKKGSSPSDTPVDGTVYSAGSVIGTSTVVRASSALTGADTGLDNTSEYFYAVFAYNGVGTLIKYLVASPLKASGITVTAEPTEQPTNLQFSAVDGTTLTGTFTAAAAGGSYLVLRQPVSNPTTLPADGKIYTVGQTLGDATVAHFGETLTFNDAGLQETTKYFYQVFFARGVNAFINYNQTNPLQNNVTTIVAAPKAATDFLFQNVTLTSFTVSFTAPDPAAAGYVVLRNQGTTLNAAPADGVVYTLGQTVGDGRVAYVGTGVTFNETLPLLAYTYKVFPYNGSGVSTNYNTIDPLEEFIAPDNDAPLIDDQTGSTVAAGSPLRIVAAISEPQSSVQTATVEYRSIAKGGATFVKPMLLVADKYEFTVPAIEVGDLGIEYTITATNTNEQARTALGKVAITFNNQTLAFNSFGSDVSNYRIVAVPLLLSAKTVAEVFGDDLGEYDGVNWRMYRYDNGSTNELSGSSLIEPGKGYWLIVKESKTIDTGAGETVDVSTAAPFTIDLKEGWNQIGNPYNFNVMWSDVLDETGFSLKLKTYVDGFNESDRLNKYQGGFVLANSAVTLKFPTAYNGAAGRVSADGPKLLTNSIEQENWEVMFNIQHGTVKNTFGGVGMNRKANTLYDEFDDFTLPRFVEYVELNHNKKLRNISYTKDIVPTSENFTWEFAVEAKLNGVTDLTWDNSYFGANEKQLILWDEQESMPVDMRQASSYSFDQSGRRIFKVFYGSDAYVTEKSTANSIHIHNLSPNPTDSDVTVTFSIPGTEQTNVEVKVVNTLGQQVTSLFNGSLAGGLHTMTWSGKDHSGMRPAQGIYLVEVVANGQKLAKRVVLK